MESNKNPPEPAPKVLAEETESSTPFDDVYRTLVTKHSKSLIPVVNEMFSLDIPEEAEVEVLNDIHFLGQQKLETDSIFRIGDQYFHVECESEEVRFGIRFVEYDFVVAVESAQRKGNSSSRFHFPHSAILALRHNSKTPDKKRITFYFSNGEETEAPYHIVNYPPPIEAGACKDNKPD